MRILLLTQCYPPEVAAAAVRARGLAREWTLRGHRVTVLTGFPNYPGGRRLTGFDYGNRVLMRREEGGVEVVRAFNLFYRSGQSLRRVADGLSVLLSHAAWGALAGASWDVVVASSPHAWLLPAGVLIASARGIPAVLDIRDHWPDTVPGFQQHPLFWGAVGRMVSWSYRRAARVVGTSPAYEALATARGLPPGRFSWIPNGLDEDRFPWPPDRSALRRALELSPDAFVVSFLGTMGTGMGLETLLEAARRLAPELPAFRLLLVGDGPSRAALEAHPAARLSCVRFLDPVPADRVSGFLGASDVSVACLEDLPEHRGRIPAKLWEILGCGVPMVLVSGDGMASRLLREARGGIHVLPGDPGRLAAALLDLARNPRSRRIMETHGREWVLAGYTREALAARYAALLEQVAAGRQET